jgi:hypothetical protein
VVVWISWAEPGATKWGCQAAPSHRVGEVAPEPPGQGPRLGPLKRGTETIVPSAAGRRARVVVQQGRWGHSVQELAPERFLAPEEVRPRAEAYLRRVEAHADVCADAATASGAPAAGPAAPAASASAPGAGAAVAAPPPGTPHSLRLPVRLYLWESIHGNEPAYEYAGRFWFFSQEQWTGYLVQQGRNFERYHAGAPGRPVRRYVYQRSEPRQGGGEDWQGQWHGLADGASGSFRIVWP